MLIERSGSTHVKGCDCEPDNRRPEVVREIGRFSFARIGRAGIPSNVTLLRETLKGIKKGSGVELPP